MKNLFTLIITLFVTSTLLAQTPQKISYQGVARNGSSILANTKINLEFKIHKNTVTGTIAYGEEHLNVPTNAYGLFTVEIGTGTSQTSFFSQINWSAEPKFLEVKLNGTSIGTTQLISVPYALSAAKADTATVAYFLGTDRIERLSVDAPCSSTPCTITRQSNAWVSTIDRTGTGRYTINFAPGTFTEKPTCVCSGGPANGRSADIFSYSGTSSVSIITSDYAANTAQDQPFQIICMGKR